MASSKAIGEYSLKSITSTNSPEPAGSILISVNWEGTATGFGALFGTSTFVGGSKSGTFNWFSVAYLENGDQLSSTGQGTYESNGKNQWSTKSIVDISDGRRLRSDGEINLAARTWKGTMYEG